VVVDIYAPAFTVTRSETIVECVLLNEDNFPDPELCDRVFVV